MNLSDMLKRAEKMTLDNAPAILTAIGVTGTVMTAYLTGRATVKATRILDGQARRVTPKPMEDVKLVWKLYIPAAGASVVTIGCIIMANRIGNRRAAAVAAAYALSERAFSEYKEKVIENFGKKKEQKVLDQIAQDHVDRNPSGNREIVITGNGDVMCYDTITGRYFLSSMETIRRAENEINKQILDDGYASLTEFYDRIGLTATAFSEEVGWKYGNMCKIGFSTTLSEDGRPCIAIQYNTAPIRNYFRMGG